MPVKLDFEAKYLTEEDPWLIGSADAVRYSAYRQILLDRAPHRGSILDIGCGLGAFLARFGDEFEELIGADVSQEAVRRARLEHPELKFFRASALELSSVDALRRQFDAIIFSDVINYFDENGKGAALNWIAEHLGNDGRALIAAWSPGGRYLDRPEFRSLVERHLVIEHELQLDSGHVAFITKRRRNLVAFTIDYETWQPIPAGMRIDWDQDVFEPTDRLAQAFEAVGVPMTVMAEMGEYLWLSANDRPIAERMERQWQDLVRRGHDVQVHLHPSWLPETGASLREGRWTWNPEFSRASDYPGDLVGLLRRCRDRLQAICNDAAPTYQATCFRAGAYQVAPFVRLHDALAEAGFAADSSVWAGGISQDRGYDFELAYSDQQPYYASRFSAHLKAPPAERNLIEVPIWTPRRGERWSIDGPDAMPAGALLNFIESRLDKHRSLRVARLRSRARQLAHRIYFGRARPFWPVISRIIPRRLIHALSDYGPDSDVKHNYFVSIGHTKARHDYVRLEKELKLLAADARIEIVCLSDLVKVAAVELETVERSSPSEEAAFQVQREYATVMSEEHNLEQADLLQQRIPLDSDEVLDLGCGAGHWTARISSLYPWMSVTGVDIGDAFIAKAAARHESASVRFKVGDFTDLPFPDDSFDCVYADNTLEHAFDVQATLREVRRVLRPGGSMVAAIPSDARNPKKTVDNHTWKTEPGDIALRLEHAGFADIRIDEVNLADRFNVPPYAPSDDRMTYVTAVKDPPSSIDVARRLTAWTYEHLDPDRPHTSEDPVEILRSGVAWCWGYARVLTQLLKQHGIPASIVTLWASDHLRGRGPRKIDTHEVVVTRVAGREVVLDPMANSVFDAELRALLVEPQLAIPRADPDERYVQRRYDLYATPYLYERIFKYSIGGGRPHEVPSLHSTKPSGPS
jgi:SAM-dependent methyltransferase